MLSLIVAKSENGVIGSSLKEGLLWNLKDDLKLFKKHTLGKSVIMGSTTFKTLKTNLPGRTCYVLSKRPFRVPVLHENQYATNDLDFAITSSLKENKEAVIIGGRQVYSLALSKYKIDKLCITTVQAYLEGDILFPEIDLDNYVLVEEKTFPKSKRNEFPFIFREYKLKN